MFRFISLTCLVLLSLQCNNAIDDGKGFPAVSTLEDFSETQFVPTLENTFDTRKNVIYAASFLLAWDELRNQIGTPVKTISPAILTLDRSNSYKGVLTDSEFMKSVKREDEQIEVSASFSKSLPYTYPMDSVKEAFMFNGKAVRAFGMPYYNEYINTEIALLYYKSDDEFILGIYPQEKGQEIILAKGFTKGERLDILLDNIQQGIEAGNKDRKDSSLQMQMKYYIGSDDAMMIPVLRFNLSKNYTDIEEQLLSANEKLYKVAKASQRTAFILNQRGAIVESEADMTVTAVDSGGIVPPKKLFFNKPFVVLMRRETEKYPYFMMKVDNAELMERFE